MNFFNTNKVKVQQIQQSTESASSEGTGKKSNSCLNLGFGY